MSKMLFNWTFFFFCSKDVQSGHHSFQGKVGLIYGCFVQLGLALIEKFLYAIISASTTECENHFSELPVINFGVFYWFDLVWHCTNKVRCVLKRSFFFELIGILHWQTYWKIIQSEGILISYYKMYWFPVWHWIHL